MKQNWWPAITLVILLSALLRQNTLLLVGVMLALVGGASHVWAHYCLHGVTYQRRFSRSNLFFGEECDLFMEVVNAKPLPLAWLITVDEIPSELQLVSGDVFRTGDPRRRILVNTVSLRWYERVTRRYRLRATQRGVWSFGPVQLSSGDIFGFSIRRRVVEERQTVVVYPKVVAVAALGLPPMYPFGDERTPQRLLDDPLRLVGSREYVPGDSYRHIHWKATARRQVLQTKLFEPSANRPLAIFLDVRTAHFINEGIDPMLLEFGISVAASVAHWGWQQRLPIGLFTNSVVAASRERIRLVPRSAPGQLHEVLELLARTEEDGRWALNSVVRLEVPTLPYGSTVVVITPLLPEVLLETVLDLAQRQYSVTLILLGNRRNLGREVADLVVPGVQIFHLDNVEGWRELDALVLAA